MKTNEEILTERIKSRDHIEGPRVGDFLVIEENKIVRMTYDWGDKMQTTSRERDSRDQGSFYLGSRGMSYSGGLDTGIDKDLFVDTGSTMDGSCWFFDRGIPQAHSDVQFHVPCRVYRLKTK